MQPIRRDLRFNLGTLPPHLIGRWHDDGPLVAHFYNALSLFFPEGERFFIHSVRHYRAQIRDPELQRQITAFIGQEALHGREHEDYNAALRAAGLPADQLERYVARLLEVLKDKLPPSAQLAVTLALEHFTAMLAHLLLSEPRLLEGAQPQLAALWRWHAVEETEHKAVAYDVYRHAVGDDLTAYLLRCGALGLVLSLFLAHVFAFQLRLAAADGTLRNPRSWAHLARHLFGRPGLLRRMIGPGLAYLRRGFHPWDEDNRHLLVQVDALVAAYAARVQPVRLAA